MASAPLPSALDVRTQAFPVLSAALIERLRAVSKVRHVSKGEILFEPGDTGVPFFVLLSGAMEIVQPDLTGEHLIVTYGAGTFHRRIHHDFRAAMPGARARDARR